MSGQEECRNEVDIVLGEREHKWSERGVCHVGTTRSAATIGVLISALLR